MEGMVFRDRYKACGAIDFTGGSLHHLMYTQVARRLNDVERPLNVGVNISVWRMVGVRDGDKRGKVQHRIAAFHGSAHAVGVANVASEYLKFAFDIWGAAI